MPLQSTNPFGAVERVGDDSFPWTRVTSRAIFESDSLTSLNDIPVVVHGSFITAGNRDMDDTELPIPLDELTEAAIVDSTLVIRQLGIGEKAEILTGIKPPIARDRIVQDTGMITDRNEPVTRVWTLNGPKWDWIDYTKYGLKDGQAEIAKSTEGISKKLFHVFMNGAGIFWKPQFTYKRLEEIEEETRDITGQTKIAIISGYAGDLNQLSSAVRDKKKRYLNVGKDVTIALQTATAAVDQLETNFRRLYPLYLKDIHMIELDDSSTASGVARRLVMQPMLSYIQNKRQDIIEVYQALGVADFEFDKIVTLTTEERAAEYAFLKQLRDDMVITPEEFKIRAAKLI